MAQKNDDVCLKELKQATRGSSAFVDNARWVFLVGMSDPEMCEMTDRVEDRSIQQGKE